MKLREIDLTLFRRAASTYMRLAYPSGSIPEAVTGRLGMDGTTLVEALASEHFEKEEGDPSDSGPMRYCLRLGSDRYPHMKLVLERCANCDDFFFAVDTHDRHFLLDEPLPAEKRARWAALQEFNRLLKQAIEDAWEMEGLPTFCSYTRSRMALGRNGHRHGERGPAEGLSGPHPK